MPLLLLGLGLASAFLIDDTVTDYAVPDESGGLAHQIRIEIAESDLRRFFVSLKRTDSLENPTLQALREQLIQFEPTSAAIERLVSELAELVVHPPAPTLAGHATDTNQLMLNSRATRMTNAKERPTSRVRCWRRLSTREARMVTVSYTHLTLPTILLV